jgi:hypothetical protein
MIEFKARWSSSDPKAVKMAELANKLWDQFKERPEVKELMDRADKDVYELGDVSSETQLKLKNLLFDLSAEKGPDEQ